MTAAALSLVAVLQRQHEYKGGCCVTKYCKVVAVCFVWLVSVVCHNCIACMFFYSAFCHCFVNGFRFTAVPVSFTI